jgi:spore coat protein CotF
MSTLLENMGLKDTVMNDEIILSNMIGAAKCSADAYLNATLTSSTPELRAMYASSLSQVINGHAALCELAISRGFSNPYAVPTDVLADAYKKSEGVTNKND